MEIEEGKKMVEETTQNLEDIPETNYNTDEEDEDEDDEDYEDDEDDDDDDDEDDEDFTP